MPRYQFEATNRQGETVNDELTAPSVLAAIAAIEQRELSIVSIRQVSVDLQDASLFAERSNESDVHMPAQGISPRPIFYRHIDAALEKRETTINALEAVCADSTPRASVREIRTLIAELRRGPSTEEFLEGKSVAWLPFILRGARESFTSFDSVFAAAGREIDARIVRKNALVYPIVVATICIGVLGVLSATVVQSFKRMFDDFGLRLPPPTRLLVWMSDQLVHHTIALVLSLCIAAGAIYLVRQAWIHFAIGSRYFGTFTAGSTSNLNSMARFTGTLAELLSIDAPLADAMRLAGRSSRHKVYDEMSQQLALEASDLNKPLSQSDVAHLFPETVIHAIQAGAGRKPCIPLLRQLSIMYDERASRRWNWTQGAMGPSAVFALGIIIAFVVISLFMPLVSLITSLT